mmetsp:Transcript_7001/g.14688  ORF Transcript_7001/g.14688 Transcript_7001/m.14688 type:complete len:221 (+) Transcript_7001:570-1232(+)
MRMLSISFIACSRASGLFLFFCSLRKPCFLTRSTNIAFTSMAPFSARNWLMEGFSSCSNHSINNAFTSLAWRWFGLVFLPSCSLCAMPGRATSFQESITRCSNSLSMILTGFATLGKKARSMMAKAFPYFLGSSLSLRSLRSEVFLTSSTAASLSSVTPLSLRKRGMGLIWGSSNHCTITDFNCAGLSTTILQTFLSFPGRYSLTLKDAISLAATGSSPF